MDANSTAEPVALLRFATQRIAANLNHILAELPKLHAPRDIAEHIRSVCRAFGAALSEVDREIGRLQTFPHRRSERVRMIDTRLRRELDRMQLLVARLQELPSAAPDAAAVKALVTESAADILFAYRDFSNALEAISRPK